MFSTGMCMRAKNTLLNGLNAPVPRLHTAIAIRKRSTIGLGRCSLPLVATAALDIFTRESGQSDSSTIAHPTKSASRYDTMLEDAQCRRAIHPGKRPAAKLPRIPIEIPEAQMRLKPRGRLFSVVTAATAGASATGQADIVSP